MENKVYTNKELSQDYFSVVTSYSADLTSYNFQRKKIAGLGIDLPTFYREHGESLDALDVKGIGERTKGILELILGKGVEEARRIVQDGKINEMRKSAFRGIPSTFRKRR